MKVLYLFGPNLGALGRREPSMYGSESLEEIMTSVGERAAGLGHEVTWRQSDHEGDLVGWLLGARRRRHRRDRDQPRGADALLLRAPRRDRGRRVARDRGAHVQHRRRARTSDTDLVVREVCRASIIGLGAGGYHLALEAMPWIT